ncbi:MAG: two-component system LytT family response regulator [Saprospiraceae bacterium]|jgi:two-component system LytT family response regulator
MKTILVDDEMMALESLTYDLNTHCPSVEIIKSVNNPEDAILHINELKPDLVMSDIQMPRMNAFTMLEKLDYKDFDLILVTAFNKYAVRAFEFSAVDYLVKPVDPQKLMTAIQKVQDRKASHDIEKKLALIMHNLKFGNNENYTLAIPTLDGAEFIEVKDLVYLSADSNYCHLFFADGEKLMVSKPLKHFANILVDHQFLRIHQSHMINTSFIKSYRKGLAGSIILKDGTTLPISRSCKSVVNQFLAGR